MILFLILIIFLAVIFIIYLNKQNYADTPYGVSTSASARRHIEHYVPNLSDSADVSTDAKTADDATGSAVAASTTTDATDTLSKFISAIQKMDKYKTTNNIAHYKVINGLKRFLNTYFKIQNKLLPPNNKNIAELERIIQNTLNDYSTILYSIGPNAESELLSNIESLKLLFDQCLAEMMQIYDDTLKDLEQNSESERADYLPSYSISHPKPFNYYDELNYY